MKSFCGTNVECREKKYRNLSWLKVQTTKTRRYNTTVGVSGETSESQCYKQTN